MSQNIRNTFSRKRIKLKLKRARNFKNKKKLDRMFKVHHFKEVVSKGIIGGSANTSDGAGGYYRSGALEFRLDDCANVSDLSAVFDQIRLNKVVVEFIPYVNTMNGTNDRLQTSATSNNLTNNSSTTYTSLVNYGPLSGIGTYIGQFYTCIDHDDATALSSKTAIQQYANCRSTPIWKQHKRIVVPAFQATIQQTPSVTTTQAKYKQWFDIATPSVRHYGVKYFLDCGNQPGGTTTAYYEIKCTYYYSCKEQR